MAVSLTDQIVEKIEGAAELYHRLLLVVGLTGGGKTTAFRNVGERLELPMINVNLELSCGMLELTERQRALKLPELLRKTVNATNGDAVLLDNIEILFDISLRQDPLQLLQQLSRNTTVIAAWNGSITNDHITYAEPDHPEYRRYTVHDLLVAKLEGAE